MIVKQGQIASLPIHSIDQLGSNTRSLETMNSLPHLLEIIHDGAIFQMQFLYSRRMDLQRQFARHWVSPTHGKNLNLGLIDFGELRGGKFEPLGDETETITFALGRGHPDVGMRGILDFGRAHKLFVFFGKEIVHGVRACEYGASTGHAQLVAGAIVIAKRLLLGLGDADGHQARDTRSVQVVEGCIDVPAVEAGVVSVILGRDDILVEGLVMRMFESDVFEALEFGDRPVTDHLNLGLMGDRLQVWMKDRAFGVDRFAVAIGLCFGIEELGELILRPWRKILLILEEDNLILVQSLANNIKVNRSEVVQVRPADLSANVVFCACRRGDFVNSDLAGDGHGMWRR